MTQVSRYGHMLKVEVTRMTMHVTARFVIDRAGIIRAADADPDYTRRPEPAQTVEVLLRLAGR